ncbi:Protein CBR-CLEC-197 [Caenorhabditis briggsae]|uniref:C-type lectin domain-containing protein n=2 Tax=Caenorhabditis briggsae TaxID=6238 RepID=A0AAE9AAV6_CAEBR|nr:Protein CBR-CLEC-197 [Caenorhabditis briggsae]ULT92993.1 hypothetical protein L3Y34_002877 [Caenorhabditis briggsae]UMM26247.1 hypothetical protein L5515_010033 [Caenorhabditis briggsae]CAP21850.1 Protein CBR-CLEC-197 [Caenorhabditis briggsae]
MIRNILLLSVALVAVSAMFRPVQNCNNEQCPPGYHKFTSRSNGPWCVKVFTGNMTWWEAERECRCTTKGAHLSGIENMEELRWLEQEAQSKLEDTVKNGAIWIGAYRRKECPSGQESTNSLCQEEKLFQFTDQNTCKTTIFQNWETNQPTNKDGDDCGVILISTEESGANSDVSGKTAAKYCLETIGSSPIMSAAGFICGVKPTPGGNNYGGGNSGYGGGNGGYGGGNDMIMIGAARPQ